MTKPVEQSDYIDDEDEGVVVPSERVLFVQVPPEKRGERMDKVLSQLIPEFSRSRIQNWIEKGGVSRNGNILGAKDAAWGGEQVVVQVLKQPQEEAFQPEDIQLNIIFEDASIIVINKPAGMVVHPAAGNWSGTLLNGILHHFPESQSIPRAGIVHRLDKDTSGLLVIAKTIEAQTDLVRQLQSRTVSRQYLALVWGQFPPSKVIREPIGRDPKDRLKMAVNHSVGKPAVTYIKNLAHVNFQGSTLSLVVCKLETGRTHQIRVHLESAGFPIFNDPVYKRRVPQSTDQQLKAHFTDQNAMPGQALHAAILGLDHPQSNLNMSWSAPPPDAFLNVLHLLGLEDIVWQKTYEKNIWI